MDQIWLFVFIDKVLLEHSHAYTFTYSLGQLLNYSGIVDR